MGRESVCADCLGAILGHGTEHCGKCWCCKSDDLQPTKKVVFLSRPVIWMTVKRGGSSARYCKFSGEDDCDSPMCSPNYCALKDSLMLAICLAYIAFQQKGKCEHGNNYT